MSSNNFRQQVFKMGHGKGISHLNEESENINKSALQIALQIGDEKSKLKTSSEPQDVLERIFPDEFYKHGSDVRNKLHIRYNIDDYVKPKNLIH